MAASFLSLPVLCVLNNGSSISGIVKSIDAVGGTLTLSPATQIKPGSRQQSVQLPSMTIDRKHVKHLEMLDVNKTTPTEANGQVKGQGQQQGQKKNKLVYTTEEGDSSAAEDYATTSKPARKSRGNEGGGGGVRRKQNQEPEARPSLPTPPPPATYTDDFDFEASLSKFDKAREFASIRSQDVTDPSMRLVAHNKKHNLLPTENVLSSNEIESQRTTLPSLPIPHHHSIPPQHHQQHQPQQHHQQHQQLQAQARRELEADGYMREREREREEKVAAAQADLLRTLKIQPQPHSSSSSQPVPLPPSLSQPALPPLKAPSKAMQGKQILKKGKGFTTPSGKPVPVVTSRQWREVLSIADIETGPNSIQRTELAGQSISSYILRQIPSPSLSSSSSTSPATAKGSTVILIDDLEEDGSQVALRVGVHLENHERKAVVLLVGNAASGGGQGGQGGQGGREALRVFSSASGRVIRDLEDLPQDVSVIIDALSSTPSAAINKVLEWANNLSLRTTTRISIDSPFNFSPEPHSSPSFNAEVIITRAAPREGQKNFDGEVVLIDVGVPPSLWRRVGVQDWRGDVWEDGQHVVPLQRV